jgi:glyoxylase-like metal-dependent hydrolase (beta-lactamase superfamily II)
MRIAERVETHGGVERHHVARVVPGKLQTWVSAYRVGEVIVDTSMPLARAAFARWLARAPVRACLTTHEHEDHVGNHELLPRGAVVYAPPIAARLLASGTPPFPIYRQFFWGYPRAKGIEAKPAKGIVEGFRVVPTPGHSADHVAYHDEATGALFSGDAYMGKFRAARLAEDVVTEVASLRRMADLDPAVLYPAHGPIVERPRKRLLEAADHFDDLRRRALTLREKGLRVRRIARELLGPEAGLTWISLGEFSHANMVRNLLR